MKRTFKKYQSLINHYNEKDIKHWLLRDSRLRNCKYLIAEKIDGSNFAVHVYPDGEVRCSKRSGFIGDNDTFFGFRDAFMHVDVQLLIAQLQSVAMVAPEGTGRSFTIHGELFGPGVQKRVNYGPGRRILFYGLDIDDVPCPAQTFLGIVPEQLRVPVVGIVDGFEAAIATSNEFPTLLNPVEGNICEGIVITPLDICPLDGNDDAFIVKSKNAKFSEQGHIPKVKAELPENIGLLSAIARSHVTEARLDAAVSKHGVPTHASQFGTYMRELMADIEAEMVREHQEQLSELSVGDRKRCLSDANKDSAELIHARFRVLGLM